MSVDPLPRCPKCGGQLHLKDNLWEAATTLYWAVCQNGDWESSQFTRDGKKVSYTTTQSKESTNG